MQSKRVKLSDAIHRDLWTYAFGGRSQIHLMLSSRGAVTSFKMPPREQIREFTRFFQYENNGMPVDCVEVTVPSVDVEHDETGIYPKAFVKWQAPLPALT